MTMRRVLACLLSTVACGRPPAGSPSRAPELGAGSCEACHQEIFNSFVQTAHFNTSAQASARSIKGNFAEGHNVLHTRSPGIYFKMQQGEGVFSQTAFDSARLQSRTERIDLVVGSGRRGQSYLYWKNGLLFELPVSYLSGIEQWINSPGYVDGRVDFGRLIPLRCLECHSTAFRLETKGAAVRYSSQYQLGIYCERCHGDGRQHAEYQASHPAEAAGKYMLNPARFSRERKLDNCALCHSGPRQLQRPPFSYRPGEALDAYFLPRPDREDLVPDVHGDQVGLLRRSKCFRSSPDLSCSTCHDVHRPERDVAKLAQKCLACHQIGRHKMAARIGGSLIGSCIDCHMPNERSRSIQINTPTTQSSLSFRSHLIGIYPKATAAVLR